MCFTRANLDALKRFQNGARPKSPPEVKTPESVAIDGVQQGFLVSFTVVQRFKNTKDIAVDARYVIPNNFNICMYDTTFRLRGEVIKPRLHEAREADFIRLEAKADGRSGIFGRAIRNGLVEFKIGNLPPKDFCETEVQCGFVSRAASPDTLFFKFPLDTSTESGATDCSTPWVWKSFRFTLRKVTQALFPAFRATSQGPSIPRRVPTALINKLFLTTWLKRPLASQCLSSGSVLAVTPFVASLPKTDPGPKEFVFVIDCSGSMESPRIEQARDCSALFIRSLPEDCFFNVVRFGTQHFSLFPESVPYVQANVSAVHRESCRARTSSGRCNRYIKAVGARQHFDITDGEVDNTDAPKLLFLDRHRRWRRRGTDPGYRSVFVPAEGDLSATVIAQLELSMGNSITGVDHDAIEICPFPVGDIAVGRSSTLFVRRRTVRPPQRDRNGDQSETRRGAWKVHLRPVCASVHSGYGHRGIKRQDGRPER
jgi:hypothetical protein